MAWSDLAPNRAVTGDNLAGSGITAKSGQTLPTGTKAITRAQANTRLNVQPIPNDNKLVLKNELIAIVNETYTLNLQIKSNVTNVTLPSDSVSIQHRASSARGEGPYPTVVANNAITSITRPINNGYDTNDFLGLWVISYASSIIPEESNYLMTVKLNGVTVGTFTGKIFGASYSSKGRMLLTFQTGQKINNQDVILVTLEKV